MLLEKYISPNPYASMLVLFGGNPFRRDEMIRHLKTIPDLSIVGTLSEEEGIKALQSLPQTNIVLIGGRYNASQRIRIKKFVDEHFPNVKLTEPGIDYPYDEQLRIQTVKKMIGQ